MRLLQDEGHGEMSLVEYQDGDIPHYAILSHIWLTGGEEGSFKDIMEGTVKNKANGYQKIKFCRKQAASHGLKHFWVDTCCIKKSSNAELTEVINLSFAGTRRRPNAICIYPTYRHPGTP
jgi:Heterokaryon incompatibility protein (HET)